MNDTLDIHKARPSNTDEYRCAVCAQRIVRVTGQGAGYIHKDSGAVVGLGADADDPVEDPRT